MCANSADLMRHPQHHATWQGISLIYSQWSEVIRVTQCHSQPEPTAVRNEAHALVFKMQKLTLNAVIIALSFCRAAGLQSCQEPRHRADSREKVRKERGTSWHAMRIRLLWHPAPLKSSAQVVYFSGKRKHLLLLFFLNALMEYFLTAEIYYSSVYSPDVGGETMVRNCRK